MTTDRVAVIIPTYNRAALIGRAITSVLAAVAPGDEVIVVDDGSTDDTAAVVGGFGDAVRYVRTPNAGPGAARNLGIRLSTCPLVTFLDSDDEWMPDKLQLQRTVMARYPHAVFCFTNLVCRMPTGETMHDILSVWRRDPRVGSTGAPAHLGTRLGPGVPYSSLAALPPGRTDFSVYVGDMYLSLMEVLYVSGIAVMVRKELAGAAFRNEEGTRLMEDWWCYARLAKASPAAYLDCELAVQHVHDGPRLTGADDVRQSTTRIEVLEQIWGRDEAFLRTHRAAYERVLRAQHLFRARVLISEGRLDEARADLAGVASPPLAYRLLTLLPSGLVRGLVELRRGALGRRRQAHA